jgi:tetratricopeptide (TPR) repeat protein
MPEKSINEIPRPTREFYDKGMQAMQRQNFDYAIDLFMQVLKKEPAFFDCRQALRVTQFKKSGGSTSFFKKMIGGASSSPLVAKGQLALRKDPLEALQVAEQILNGDPNSSAGHKLLADAALAADLPKTACLSLEILVKNSPKDFGLNMELAQAFAATGQTAKAEIIYAELQRAHPHKPEIAQALKNLSANNTMKEGGYDSLADGQGSYRDILANKDEAVALEQEKREVKSDDVTTRLIHDGEARLVQEPKNLKLVRSLAELYVQKKDFDKALGYYEIIRNSESGGDPSLERAIADTALRKFDHAMSLLDPTAPDHAEHLARLQAERTAFQLSECQKRAEKYPTDLQIRYELGELYFKAGKITEAIGEFQKAQNNPQRRLQSLGYLGQCFARRGMNDSAVRMLQNAIKEKVGFDEEKKELIYQLGCVLEKMNKADEANEQFMQIYESDIAYKDVGAKVDAYLASKGS